MSWVIHLVQTTTGQVGRTISPASGSWSIEINKTDSGSVKINKDDLRGVGIEWFSPWWASVVWSYQTDDGRLIPWCGGPIISWPSEDTDTLSLDWRGMREVFAHRHMEKDYKHRGLSLGTIAWEVVKAGMDKPGGRLPIVHGSPTESGSSLNERTYEAWNLANNECAKRLTEISEVINGPDIMFRPQWANDDMTAVEWSFVHGTSYDPTIAQALHMVWDTTAAGTHITAPSVVSDGSQIATRVWGTGAGEGAGTVITKAESLELVKDGLPFLEAIISDPDQTKAAPILEKCRAALATSRYMVDQLSLSVNAAHKTTPLGTWFVGDDVTVNLSDDWLSVPSGDRIMRIIKASGGLDELVKVELQEGQWFDANDLI